MSYSRLWAEYRAKNFRIASLTRSRIEDMSFVPDYHEYMANPASHASSRDPQPPPAVLPPRTYKVSARRAEEQVRRDYQRRYGGDHSLMRYQQIHRDAARSERYRKDEPVLVVHRRGSFEYRQERRPRETKVDRLAARYETAMAEQEYFEKLDMDPHAFRGQQKRVSLCRDYEEEDLDRQFADLRARDRRARRKSAAATGRALDQEYFRIPQTNRGDDLYIVKGYGPKKRASVGGRPIRHLTAVERPTNEYFGFF